MLALTFIASPFSAFAATSSSGLEVSGWIPYWRTTAGTADAQAHLSQFSEVNPFGYTVRSDGSLNDAMGLDQTAWSSLIKAAHKDKVRVVPTVMWSDTNSIDAILSNPQSRAQHIQNIVRAVNQNGFDGIDIDYEAKKASTRDAFSAFLGELQTALSSGKTDKWLECTVEARMPLSARYSGTPPANIEYANDLPKVNQYCDRVRVMTYDQQTADIQLNREHAKDLYAPVADVAWVEKVLDYMSSDIKKSKMVMGIATYGAIYQAMPNVDGSGYSYTKLQSFNPKYGSDVATEYGLTPVRGVSGELTLSYVPKDTPDSLPSQKDLEARAPKSTASGLLAAVGALTLAKQQHQQAPVTFLTWSDASAIEQKVKLAERMGIAGIAIFKIDGGEDAKMWDVLPSSAPKLTLPPTGTVGTTDSGSTATTTPPATPTTPKPTTGGTGSSTSPAAYKFTTDLFPGMSSTAVMNLQKILVKKGYLKAAPTGYFGLQTQAAMRLWQRDNGISATGNLGPLSRAKMNVSQ